MTAQDHELSAALGWPGGIGDPVLDRKTLLQMVAALRLASQQALEALYQAREFTELYDTEHAAAVNEQCHDTIATISAALAQEQTEPDISRCPQCNGPADNGFDRSFPPSPYLCTKCMAEPVAALTAQRDVLLEALKAAEPYLRHADVDYNVYVQCRAAIALVEGRVKAVEEGK